jgi:O-antigen/teichoic acid export membrane protein
MIKKLLKKDLTKVLMSSIAAQFINIFSSVFIARYLPVEEIGIIAAITALVSIFAGVGCLRYNQAIIISDSQEECDSLFSLSLFLSLIFSGLSLIIILILNFITPDVIHKYSFYIYFVPIWTFSSLFALSLNEVNVYHQRFDLFSKNHIFRAVIGLVFQLPVIRWPSIIIPLVVKTIAELFYLKGNFKITVDTKLHSLKLVAKKHIQFPLHETPSQLMLLASKNFIFFAYTFYYSNYALGLFSMAYRVFKIPHLTIGENVRRVIEVKLKSLDELSAHKYIDKVFMALIIVSISISVAVYLISPYIIPLILGKKWIELIGYINAFIPLIILTISTIPFLAYFKVNQRLGIISFNNLLQLLALLGCVLLLAKKNSGLEFAGYYSITVSMCMSFIIFQYYFQRLRSKRI